MAEDTEGIPKLWKYDVFLSFRGKDVRDRFLSHLYYNLVSCRISTFMDDAELERGERISQQLLEAIETSKIFIVVLSQDYASSSWCLDELVHIIKCRRSNSRQLVFPIFFDTDPSDVRRQRGSFGESFSKHESRQPLSKVKDWREALTEVGNLSGWHMRRYRNERTCIEDITKEIMKRLPCQYYLHVPSYAVGMESRLGAISELLSSESDDVRVIGICEMGGIGKTTLATTAFNEFSHRFEEKSFLKNFSEYSKKPDGITNLQKKLCSDILKRNVIEFNGLDHAVKERFRSKSVLIVLDDVDDIHQLNSAAIDLNCFGRGSRIIITTRNKRLLTQLTQLPVEVISYEPVVLDRGESLQLFSWHAFRTSEPPKEFLQLSEKVVDYCAGLPLALEILGASLIKRNISEWKGTLDLLKIIPDDNIQAKLRISFDALNSVQKDAFLYIACFFIGMDRDYVSCILDGCHLCPGIVLSVLMERCLITVSDNNIMVHDLLRDMGRQIFRELSPKNSGKHSRLWDHDDVIGVLTEKSGTNATEWLSLKAEVIDVKNLEVEAFAQMQDLRLLQLTYVNLKGCYTHFPKDLRWLSWHGFSSESFPKHINLISLVALDMQYSNIKRLWKAHKPANMLKYLNLSHSVYLIETPDFSDFPNLEKLLLINCRSLVLVHKSIGMLHKKLSLVNLTGCTKLAVLPNELFKLKSLETLILPDYKNIMEDHLLKSKAALLDLDFSAFFVKALIRPVSLNGLALTYLTTLSLSQCSLSAELPEQIPKDIKSLDLQGNSFRNWQTDFAATLPNLRVLRLSDCSELQSILSLPRSLRDYYVEKCISLERAPDLSEFSSLKTLHLNHVETPGIHNPRMLIIIKMERCNAPYTTGKMIIEDWIERNRGCIYFPGHSLPNWVSFKEKMHSFSFTVPETQNSDSAVGFTLWTRFLGSVDDSPTFVRAITVKNQTKGGAWIHSLLESKPWNSNALTKGFRIETGDQLEIDVHCDVSTTVQETGFAIACKTRDSSYDFSFTHQEDLVFDGNDVSLHCFRSKFEKGSLHAAISGVVRLGGKREKSNLVNGVYACSYFPEPPCSFQENTQKVVEERHDHKHCRFFRKMRMGVRTFLGAISFLALVLVSGKVRHSSVHSRQSTRGEKEADKD